MRGLIERLFHEASHGEIYEWHLRHRMSRRRAFLHLVAIFWIIQGVWVLTVPGELFSRPGPSPLDWMDSSWWALLWFAAGVVAFWVSLDRRAPDSIGFAVLIGPAITWSAFGCYSFGVAIATDGLYGEWLAWRIGALWALHAAIIRLVANWEDVRTPPARDIVRE